MSEKSKHETRFGVSDWIEGAVWVVIAIGAIGWCVDKFAG
ncbi:hypothetical protein GCM10027091_66310 [Streptomyces daliensis]